MVLSDRQFYEREIDCGQNDSQITINALAVKAQRSIEKILEPYKIAKIIDGLLQKIRN